MNTWTMEFFPVFVFRCVFIYRFNERTWELTDNVFVFSSHANVVVLQFYYISEMISASLRFYFSFYFNQHTLLRFESSLGEREKNTWRPSDEILIWKLYKKKNLTFACILEMIFSKRTIVYMAPESKNHFCISVIFISEWLFRFLFQGIAFNCIYNTQRWWFA